MILRTLVMRADRDRSIAMAWFKASPMISDCLSTADCSSSSPEKSSKECPSRNFRTRMQAFSTSKSSFLTSREFIHRHLGLLHRLQEVGVLYRFHLYKVDRGLKKLPEPLSEKEVVM